MLVVLRCFYLVDPHVQTKSRLAAGNDASSEGTLIKANKRPAKTVDAFQPFAGHNLERASAQLRRIALSPTSTTSTGCLAISRIQYLAASFCQGKELRCKPYHPIGMGLLYLMEITETNFLHGGIL